MADQRAPSAKREASGAAAPDATAASALAPESAAVGGEPAFKPARSARIRAYRLLLTLATAVFALDQLTKWWIVMNVPFNPMHVHGGGGDLEIIPGFFYIIHVGNTGAA